MLWNIESAPSQVGKTVLITGANSGIGFATAVHLARKGARIVLACRDYDKGRQARLEIHSELPYADIELVTLDLASLVSIHCCTRELLSRHDRLDVLGPVNTKC